MQEIYLIQSYKSAQEVESPLGTIIYIYIKSNIKQYKRSSLSLGPLYYIYTWNQISNNGHSRSWGRVSLGPVYYIYIEIRYQTMDTVDHEVGDIPCASYFVKRHSQVSKLPFILNHIDSIVTRSIVYAHHYNYENI